MLQDIAPREASVHFLMGKLHKRLGNLDDALTCLNAALDLQVGAARMLCCLHMEREQSGTTVCCCQWCKALA